MLEESAEWKKQDREYVTNKWEVVTLKRVQEQSVLSGLL